MSAAALLAQLAPMAAPSGDALSAGSMAAQDIGGVFAGLMAAEALGAGEAAEANTAEGPVEAAAVDASQPLVSSALLMALQPRPAPVPVVITEGDPGFEAESETAGGGGTASGALADAFVQAGTLSPSAAVGAANAATPAAASPAPQSPPSGQAALQTPERGLTEAQHDPSPVEAKAEADLDAQVAKALAAVQAAPSAQAAVSSGALAGAAAAATVAARPARAEGSTVSNASANRSADASVSEGDGSATAWTEGTGLSSRPVAGQTSAAAPGAAQPGASASGNTVGANVTPQPAALASAALAEAPLDGEAPAQVPSGAPAPAAPAAAAPPSVNTTAFSQLAQSTLDTTIHLAAQITRRLEGRATRFEMGLTPEGLGRVDVKLDIDAGGRLTARLAFDNPLAATELRGRADELRRELQAAGFEIAHDGLEFSDRQSSSSGEGFDQRQGRAFAGAARLTAEAELALPAPTTWMSLNLTPRGVDMKV